MDEEPQKLMKMDYYKWMNGGIEKYINEPMDKLMNGWK